MSKVLLFVSMEDDFWAFFIGERHIGRYEILSDFYSIYCLHGFVPDEDSCFFDAIIGLAKVMNIGLLSFALIEDTFHRFLLDFCYIGPSLVVLGMYSLAKAMILQHFFMFFFGENWVKRMLFFDSPLITVDQSFFLRLNDLIVGYIGNGHENFLGVGRVGEGGRVGVL